MTQSISHIAVVFAIASMGLLSTSCKDQTNAATLTTPSVKDLPAEPTSPPRPRILLVHSYNTDYAWTRSITAGVERRLSAENVDLRVHYMNTKRSRTDTAKADAARRAAVVVSDWKPDVVITADDNAAKFFVVPYLKDTQTPVVFCGVNWDASIYGFPAPNVTGMVEITLFPQTIEILQQYAPGKRVGLMLSDTLSERKNVENYQQLFDIPFETRYVRTAEELKREFVAFQKEVDMVLLHEIESLKGFDRADLIDFMKANTKVPTGAMDAFMAPYVIVTCAKEGEEQGGWSAETAMRIIHGEDPSAIPPVTNKRAIVYLNMSIAKELDIEFPMKLIEQATFVE